MQKRKRKGENKRERALCWAYVAIGRRIAELLADQLLLPFGLCVAGGAGDFREAGNDKRHGFFFAVR